MWFFSGNKFLEIFLKNRKGNFVITQNLIQPPTPSPHDFSVSSIVAWPLLPVDLLWFSVSIAIFISTAAASTNSHPPCLCSPSSSSLLRSALSSIAGAHCGRRRWNRLSTHTRPTFPAPELLGRLSRALAFTGNIRQLAVGLRSGGDAARTETERSVGAVADWGQRAPEPADV